MLEVSQLVFASFEEMIFFLLENSSAAIVLIFKSSNIQCGTKKWERYQWKHLGF